MSMAQATTGHWNYPLEETNGNARPPAKRQERSEFEDGQGGYREMKSVRRVPSDAWNVMSDSEGTKQRRASLKQTNASASRKRSRNMPQEKSRERQADRFDDSAWIHRDKLAQIEIMEMEQAGFPVRQSRRSISDGPEIRSTNSRSRSRSRKSATKESPPEQIYEEAYGQAYGGAEDYGPMPVSTTPVAEEGEEHFDPNVDYEFRTPEELAAERGSIRSQITRPSTSRLPVAKASPVPVPHNVLDRDSPLPRSRHGSASFSGNWDELQYARKARSGSIGSQAILDDEEGMRTPPRPGSSYIRSSNENSPPKSRVPNRGTPSSRKGSVPNGTPRPGSSSGAKARATSAKDRATSSGHRSRPSTSHAYAPEGDAPWISSMYKPDPRLPPDQQMLPTHAKRMMQEQWEKEGIAGTTYDRDLRPISNQELPSPTKKSNSQVSPPLQLGQLEKQRWEPEKAPTPSPKLHPPSNGTTSPSSTNMNAWPLTPKSDQKSETSITRPGTSGGYKITPTIASPPQIQRSEGSTGAQANATLRVPDLDEKADAQSKKGGCGCCIVM